MNPDDKAATLEISETVTRNLSNRYRTGGTEHAPTNQIQYPVNRKNVHDKLDLGGPERAKIAKTVAAIISASMEAAAQHDNASRFEPTTTSPAEETNAPKRKAPEATLPASRAHAPSGETWPTWRRGQTILGFTNEEIRIDSSSSSDLQVSGTYRGGRSRANERIPPSARTSVAALHRAGSEPGARPVPEAFRRNGAGSHQEDFRPAASARKKQKNLCDKCISAMRSNSYAIDEPRAEGLVRRPVEARASTSLLQQTRKLFGKKKKAAKPTVAGAVTRSSRFEDFYEGGIKDALAVDEQKQGCGGAGHEKGESSNFDGSPTSRLRGHRTTQASPGKRNIFGLRSGLQRSKFGNLKISEANGLAGSSVEAGASLSDAPAIFAARSIVRNDRPPQIVGNFVPQPEAETSPSRAARCGIIGRCATCVDASSGMFPKSTGIPNASMAPSVGFRSNSEIRKPNPILTIKPKENARLVKKTPKTGEKTTKPCKKVTFSADIDVFSFCAADSIFETFYRCPELKDGCPPNLYHCFPAVCSLPAANVDIARNVLGGKTLTLPLDGTAFVLDLKEEDKAGPMPSLVVSYNASTGKFELVGVSDAKTNSGDCGLAVGPAEIKAVSWLQPEGSRSDCQVILSQSEGPAGTKRENSKSAIQNNPEAAESDILERSGGTASRPTAEETGNLQSVAISESCESKDNSSSLNLLDEEVVADTSKQTSDESLNEEFSLCPLMAASVSDSNQSLHEPEAKHDADSQSDLNDTLDPEALKQIPANLENKSDDITKTSSQSAVDHPESKEVVERLNKNSSLAGPVSTEETSKGEAEGVSQPLPKSFSAEEVEPRRGKDVYVRPVHPFKSYDQVIPLLPPMALHEDKSQATLNHEFQPFYQSSPKVSKSEFFFPRSVTAMDLGKTSRPADGRDHSYNKGQSNLRASYSESNVANRLQKEMRSVITQEDVSVKRGSGVRPAADNLGLGSQSVMRLPAASEPVPISSCEDADSCQDEDAILLPEKRIRLRKQLSRSMSGIFKRFDLDAGKKGKTPGKKDKKR